MKWRMHWTAVALTAGLLAACGGGSGESTGPEFSSVKVAGDSLADSGTFGFKFTVQGSAPTGAGSTPIWPELVAQDFGMTLCAHYDATFSGNGECSNYAIGGGRINNTADPTSPLSILVQMQALGAAGFGSNDLVLVDGGGNDAADLIRTYLAAATDGGASYAQLLGTQLDPDTLNTLLAQGEPGLVQAGGAYMRALAAVFANGIRTQLVDKGAARVAVLNMPDVTLTPQFGMVLGAIAASQGGTVAQQLAQVFGGWVQAFNAALDSELKDTEGVTVVDFNATLTDMVADPTANGLTNVTTPACPATGVDGGLPTYDFPTCTAATLSETPPPVGATGGADWWKTYAFSDSFHPTPRGHEIMADMVRDALK